MIRGILTAFAGGVVRLFSARASGGEVFDQGELVQHYGFASSPLDGAELFIAARGNLAFCIASDDRRYRLELQRGEAALYDDLGQKVHLTRNGIVLKSATSVTIDAPNLQVTGNIVADGEVSDGTGKMSDMRTTYNGHFHPDPQGGATGQTTQRMQ